CFVSFFFFSSRRRHTISKRDWSSDVCSSDLLEITSKARRRALPCVADAPGSAVAWSRRRIPRAEIVLPGSERDLLVVPAPVALPGNPTSGCSWCLKAAIRRAISADRRRRSYQRWRPQQRAPQCAGWGGVEFLRPARDQRGHSSVFHGRSE